MDILVKPIVTEKMTKISEKLNRFGFIVNNKANKLQIRKAVEQMYNVTVTEVNTKKYLGKMKSRNTKAKVVKGRTNSYKKAIVSLSKGDKIDFFANI
jgi:large subunit ribosomal protein L23